MEENIDYKAVGERVKRIASFLVFKDVIKAPSGLAEILDYNASSVSKVFQGYSSYVNDTFIDKLCNKLNCVNRDWILYGSGDEFTEDEICEYHKYSDDKMMRIKQLATARNKVDEDENKMQPHFKLYDLDSAKDFKTLLENKDENVLGAISIPNVPKCDGAIRMRGDSMYPAIKSGDIIGYKEVRDINRILYGEMYVMAIDTGEDDEQVAVRYVQRSETEGYLRLVSENAKSGITELPVNSIRSIASVKLVIRINSMS